MVTLLLASAIPYLSAHKKKGRLFKSSFTED
nr:MAG TPA: hypothetical protein [Caudoviricetes sp.]DAP29657.1 MAG TPA: hypothetical protein [Caudoviricetes sp.]